MTLGAHVKTCHGEISGFLFLLRAPLQSGGGEERQNERVFSARAGARAPIVRGPKLERNQFFSRRFPTRTHPHAALERQMHRSSAPKRSSNDLFARQSRCMKRILSRANFFPSFACNYVRFRFGARNPHLWLSWINASARNIGFCFVRLIHINFILYNRLVSI